MATSGKTRLTLQIDPDLKKEFERLAKSRRRASSNEVEILMEQELDRAYKSGELNKPDNISQTSIGYDQAVAIVKANSGSGHTQIAAILETAQLLGLDGEKLLEACTQAGLKLKKTAA